MFKSQLCCPGQLPAIIAQWWRLNGNTLNSLHWDNLKMLRKCLARSCFAVCFAEGKNVWLNALSVRNAIFCEKRLDKASEHFSFFYLFIYFFLMCQWLFFSLFQFRVKCTKVQTQPRSTNSMQCEVNLRAFHITLNPRLTSFPRGTF